MASVTTVCIYNDLTACQTTVTVRSADNKTACWVDEELRMLIDHLCWKNYIKNILLYIFMNLFLCYFRIMLC